MSQQNIELVKSLYAAFFRRDVPFIISKLAPDFEVSQSTEVPWGGTYRGPEGLQQFFSKLTAHLNNAGLPFERFLDAGEDVVVIGRTQGTVKANGKAFDVPLVHVWRIRDGLAVRFSPYIDNPTMLAALNGA
jgi:ketosteroid isomerase-like protein